MKLLDQKAILGYFAAPSAEELEKWCNKNGIDGVYPTQGYMEQSDLVLAAALWYASTKYQDVPTIDRFSFATLTAGLVTGWYGGFGTENYAVERKAESIVLALAGCIKPDPESDIYLAPPSIPTGENFTALAIRFLEEYYFIDKEQAVSNMLAAVGPEIGAKVVLSLADTRGEQVQIINAVKEEEVLTVRQVAEQYNLTPKSVRLACIEGRLRDNEKVKTSAGWLITRAGAERLWGYRRIEKDIEE